MNPRSAFVPAMVMFVSTFCFPIDAEEMPCAKPEDVGMSSDKLKAVDGAIAKLITNREVSGAVAVVARKGHVVHSKSFGLRDLETKSPMSEDTIFTIRSMTKPVTCVAALILVDEGLLKLDAPIHDHFPAFKRIKVRTAGGGKVAPRRPPTIRDLLRFTDGLPPNLQGFPKPERPVTSFEGWIDRLADVGLEYQPGEGATYGISLVVMGGIIRKVTDQTLGEFMRDRIFEPLDMRDTAHFVPQEKRHRLAAVYSRKCDQLVPAEVPEAPLLLPPTRGDACRRAHRVPINSLL